MALGASWIGWTMWRASEALKSSREQAVRESVIAFERTPWRTPVVSVEVIDAVPEYRAAAAFDGKLYLAGDGGVTVFADDRAPMRRYRPGLETPPARVTALAAGLDPATDRPALFGATAGEGLLVLSSGGEIEQVRSPSAPERDLTAVLPLAGGRVLLGSEQAGVLVYDANGLAPLHPELRKLKVTALTGDESAVWIGTLDAGAIRFAGGVVERIDEAAGLPDDRVFSIVAREEVAYVGTAAGVAEIRSGRVSRKLAEGVIASSLMLDGDRLLVGSFDQGVAEIRIDLSRRAGRASWREAPEQVRSFLTVDGALFAVAPDGLHPLTGGRAVLATEGTLTDRNVSALRAVSDGRLWVGFFDHGLDVMDGSQERLTHVENETVFCVNRIVEDGERGIVYAGTANGLAAFSRDGRLREVRRGTDGLISDHVTDLVVDDGALTVATPAGLTFLGSTGARSLYALQGLVNNHVYTLGMRNGRLLAGTLGGLSLLEGEVVQRSWTTASSNLGHNWITAIEPFEDGWMLGTYGAGVVRLRSDGTIENPPELAGVEINPNALAMGETVYAGSLDRGLLVYDPTEGRWVEHTAGLPALNVTALEVANGIVYIGTDNGLVGIEETAIRLP